MVKVRDPKKKTTKNPSSADIEAFGSAADGAGKPAPNPTAKRDYKSVRMNFNEFEYLKLEELSRKTGRSKMGAIRWAVVQMAQEVAKT
jgi:hypothetical protein